LPVEDGSEAMRIEVVTLFPELIDSVARWGITGRALERGLWTLGTVNPRDFATDRHRTIDDRPYGGGPGMVMMAAPLEQAIAEARERVAASGGMPKVIYLSPQGEPLKHERVAALAKEEALVLLAGRYEGIDERIVERSIDLELAVGDFVVSGGELPALLLIEALVRQLPGALNDAQSSAEESFVAGLLDCPHYTRPEVYEGRAVPAVLLSGDHAKIARWRLKQSLGRTWLRRPDLLAGRNLSGVETELLAEFRQEMREQAGS
jgi:tRNA (guanine37-N1)-methyltransferase